MTWGINKVILIGNIGNKNEVKTTKNGGCFINFSLATNVSVKDKDTGQRKEIPEWHNVTCYDKTAEIIDKYTKKGSKLFIEGYLKTDEWKDKDDRTVKTTKIVATNLTLLDSKQDGVMADGREWNKNGNVALPPPPDEDFDDDLPF